MVLGIMLLIIGLLGFLQNKRNIFLMLICLEILLLSITLLIILTSWEYNDLLGELYSLYIVCLAGIESALGLSILVCYYKLRGSINHKI